jgi:F420-0:gamma-glutamyl ligase
MGKRDDVPVVLVRGYDMQTKEDGSARELLRSDTEDLFR